MGADADVHFLLRSAIIERLGEARSRLWFGEAVNFRFTDEVLEVQVPNTFFRDWIERHFLTTLHEATASIIGKDIHISFAVHQDIPPVAPDQLSSTSTHANLLSIHPSPTKQAYTFNQPSVIRLQDFIVGPGNQLAYAAAKELLQFPASFFNPLFIYGGIGLGKTFLLTAIQSELQQSAPHLHSLYITAESFTNLFLHAMRQGTLPKFRTRFRTLQALMLDDVHFLAAKRATQDEFLHTFNSLHALGVPIVLASDRHPKLIPKLTTELVTRFLSGMVIKLEPPDLPTRLAILKAKSKPFDVTLPDSVLTFLASHLRSNVRELQGALHNVLAYSKLTHRPIDLSLAQAALRETIHFTPQQIQLEDIDRVVCQFFELTPELLKSEDRARFVSYPRMLAMYLARKHTHVGYSEIGRYFGGRNHSTVIAAERKMNHWLRDLERGAFLPGMESVAEILATVERILNI